MQFHFDPETGLNYSPEAPGRWFEYREGQGYAEVLGPAKAPPSGGQDEHPEAQPANAPGQNYSPTPSHSTAPDSGADRDALYRFDSQHGFVRIQGAPPSAIPTRAEDLVDVYRRLSRSERMRFWLMMDETEEDFTLPDLFQLGHAAEQAQVDMRDPAAWAEFFERSEGGREKPYIWAGQRP